jgi:hypothetical protein
MAIVSIGTQTTTGLMLGLQPLANRRFILGEIGSAPDVFVRSVSFGTVVFGGVHSISGVDRIHPGTRQVDTSIPRNIADPQNEIMIDLYGMKYENVTTPIVYQFWS